MDLALSKPLANYASQKAKFHDFLTTFSPIEPGQLHPGRSSAAAGGRGSVKSRRPRIYHDAVTRLKHKGSVKVAVDDLLAYLKVDPDNLTLDDKSRDIVTSVLTNTQRAVELLQDVCDEIRSESAATDVFGPTSTSTATATATAAATISASANDTVPQGNEMEVQRLKRRFARCLKLPTRVLQQYTVRLKAPSVMEAVQIHRLRSKHIGCLIKIEGQVVKTGTVKPVLAIASLYCRECGVWQFQNVTTARCTIGRDCKSAECQAARRRDTLFLSMTDCVFQHRQDVRVQELSHNVPSGTVPRQVRIRLTGDLCYSLAAGDAATISGVYLPVEEGGWRHPQQSAASRTFVECHDIYVHRSVTESLLQRNGTETIANGAGGALEFVQQLVSANESFYERLAYSIAPSIHGHTDVKKALLLQMIGGVSDHDSSNAEASSSVGNGNGNAIKGQKLQLRGDIHILLIGDPGIAKSQMLLRICKVCPRAQYTCGKGASGVGLTASVTKDPITNEFSIEGGAIVLADKGVCCVDEFDKMPEQDRTAIHEVMEQQTVSISKAGLTARLKARTTILAAANPVRGRYDTTISPQKNIGLPFALLSRFDVIFLLLDNGSDPETDRQMARYLLKVHKEKKVVQNELPDGTILGLFSEPQLRSIIAVLKNTAPVLAPDVLVKVAEAYMQMRETARQRGDRDVYVTPRTLMAILRLSQAHARIYLRPTITMQDFEEACRIIRASQESVNQRMQDQKSEELDRLRKDALHFIVTFYAEQKEAHEANLRASKKPISGRKRRQEDPEVKFYAKIVDLFEAGANAGFDAQMLENVIRVWERSGRIEYDNKATKSGYLVQGDPNVA